MTEQHIIRIIPPPRKPKRKQATGYELAKRRARRAFERLWASQNNDFGKPSAIQDGALSKHQAWLVFLTAWLEGAYDTSRQERARQQRHHQ